MSKILINKYSFLCVFYFNFLVKKKLNFLKKTFFNINTISTLAAYSIIINIINKIIIIKKKKINKK